MPENEYEISKCNCHIKNHIIKLFNSISYCLICSTFIIKNNSSFETLNKTIKPRNYEINKENPSTLQWLKEEDIPNDFLNKKEYKKYRALTVKNMKNICYYFSLSLETYFLSIAYLDKICSKLYSFNNKTLNQISLLCIILATKFNENKLKACEVQSNLKENFLRNYQEDEIYVLKLLNYELNICTSYDIVMDILFFGFVFENENFNREKLYKLYSNIDRILYMFSESNSYIDLTSKQIAIGIIGFIRELLNLNPFSENIQNIFLFNNNKSMYIFGLNIIKKRIKIESENNYNNKTNS